MGGKTELSDFLMYFDRNKPKYWNKNNSDKTNEKDGLQLQYYLDIKPRIDEGHFDLFNEDEIPIRKRGKEVCINPVNVCAYGLGMLDIYVETQEKQYFNVFLKMANWLVKNQVVKNDIGIWYYNYDLRRMRKPWISGMAQGEALSVLTRAYKMTSNEKYIECAEKCFNSFKYDIKDGGVTGYIDSTYKIFEEYVSVDESHVLNGFMYSLFGLFDYYVTSKKEEVKNLFDDGIYTLEKCLYKYDRGYWSKYDLSDVPIASYMYHNLHVIQLDILYDISGNKVFKDYSDLWKEYQNSFLNCMRALFEKLLTRCFRSKV